jgi:ABC-type molybdate transport system ATPase subunit
MNHRHLLPDEIDLLVDDEVGFGVTPLKAHVRDCSQCRAQVEEARRVLGALEEVPHFSPSHTFTDRVMAQVPVFVPWHVTARDTVARWLPQSRSARIAVAALATSAASVLTVTILWIATQTDVLVLASSAAGDQLQNVVYNAGRDVLATVFGDQMFAIIQRTGMVGIAAALVGLATAAAASIAGLRALAGVSSRRRA